MTEIQRLNEGIPVEYQYKVSTDFAPVHRQLLDSRILAGLGAEVELYYYKLLLIVDHWGNCPADYATIMRLMYLFRPAPSEQTVNAWTEALEDAGLAETYLAEGLDVDNRPILMIHLCNHYTSTYKDRPLKPRYPTHPKQPDLTKHKENERNRRTRRQQADANPNYNVEDNGNNKDKEQEQAPYGCLDFEDARDTPPSEILLNCLACRRFAASPQMHEWAQLNVARTLASVAGSWPVATRERTRRILAHYDLLPHGKVDLDNVPDPPQDPRLFEEIPTAELLGDLEGLDL